MKHSRGQHCQPFLEHFLELNLCILYVVSKLGKSAIQCFKRCTIRSWNEGVTAIASRSLQSVAKSAFCCEIFAAFLYSAMEFLLKLPDTCRKLERWEPQGGSQLCSPAKIAWCCEIISQPSWVPAKSRRHYFLLRNGSWSLPIFATDIGRYFPLDFCCLNPKILLVNLQLHDSLVFKLVKRPNIFVTISFILCHIYASEEPVPREVFERSSFCNNLVRK